MNHSLRSALSGLAAGLAASLCAVAIVQILILRTFHFHFFIFIFAYGATIAFLHAALIGGTAYIFLIDRWPVRWGNAALTGMLIGAVPAGLFFLAVAIMTPESRYGFEPVLFCGFCGLVGGLVFRAVRGRDPRDTE